MKRVFLVILVLFMVGCTHNSKLRLFQSDKKVANKSTYQVKTSTYNRAIIDYRILKNDRLSIVIYQHPDLIPQYLQQRGVLVDSSGSVSLPLVGRVHLAGLTQTQATKKLEKSYARYLKKPALNVEVLNKRVYVLGEVNKPGPITLDKEQMNILEAISFAGGLSDDALRDDVIVISNNSYGQMQLRHLDLTNFSKLVASNMILKPNDIVYIQPSSAKEFDIATKGTPMPFDILNRITAPFVSIKTITQ